ncbi:D-alanyl-D-alanine carboxypeptidase [Heyndrickxia shackletonii]|uniref:serine-type D-Ala-D-Ala carboxypeptidase n=1 Tax=Heyndrickxia shackletonii TaxID=157838 RepID=A0A0Q3TI80_9BACI|nr:D-alanyl-D-alanine carboxypeptidase family protein [Heyndrickxia shackletonii]KQL53646.1 D-alanyl-D-alanine carboxypeptidase [Heyndrickxia shackletonii]MBB2480939.1 D-alanyl-D-alanine carboxypeptidase [Bacillus sp. APMAM]NEZ00480.1 D-alanyl-D-alanine carboxypeptidase [Heyndrickxia shackletonii]RTZ55703.1 D-alanyl-D-alanine carboxypeptidase [Bacillus sp. SAJ1]
MKKICSFIICSFIIFSSIVIGSAYSYAAEGNSELAPEAKSAILIERDTGSILYEKNSHEKLPPASMTKVMTMLLIMQAIDKGTLSWNEKVRTSEYAASMGGSQIFLEPGEEMTVEQMLKGIAIGSANDAAVAMAEKIAGSEESFVAMMNKEAKALGLKDTHFQNTTGLPVKDHYSSAYDMAIMAKELLKYEKITKFTGTYEDYLRENTDKKFWLVNTNKLVKFYPGVDGLKTGFTNEAKFCLTATAKKNNMRVIAVVFGAPSTKVRNAQVSKMLDFAFSQYVTHPLYKSGQSLGEVKVSKGEKKYIHAVTSEPISVLTKRGEKSDNIVKTKTFRKNLKAPIHKGDIVGTLTVQKDGKVLVKSDLVAKENVKSAGWWKLFKRSFGLFTQN